MILQCQVFFTIIIYPLIHLETSQYNGRAVSWRVEKLFSKNFELVIIKSYIVHRSKESIINTIFIVPNTIIAKKPLAIRVS